MSNYSSFAFYYDELMHGVNYEAIANYLIDLLDKLNHKPGLTLDMACGTGNLTFELLKRNIDVFGLDSSMEMLAQAKDKSYDIGKEHTLFLCQKMQDLDLYGSVDTVFCVLDSLNHLRSFKDVEKTFERVFLFLNPSGYFIFDMNTPYKHNKILANNTFVYDEKNVYCIWENYFVSGSNPENKVDISLTFFEKNGSNYTRSNESFSERAYDEQVIIKALEKSGFVDISTYSELSFEKPCEHTERIVYVAKKA